RRPGSRTPRRSPVRHCAHFQTAPSPWRWPAASAGSAPGNLRTGQQLGGKVDGVVRHRSAPPTTPGQTPASGTQPNSCEKRNGKNGTSNRAGSPPAPPPAVNRVALELVFRRILRSPFAPANLYTSAQPRPPPAPRHTTAAGTVP